jgi:HK97 family phage major capsid protein
MNLKKLIEDLRSRVAAKTTERGQHQSVVDSLRTTAERGELTDGEATRVVAAGRAVSQLDGELTELNRQLSELEAEVARDEAADRLAREVHPGAAPPGSPEGALGGDQRRAETRWIRTHDERAATVARGQRFADHEIVREHAARSAADQHVIGQHGSLGQMVRAMTTSSGSAIVPTVWAGDIIDRARNLAAVLRAGAEIVPMDAKTVNIGRLTGDPTAAFRTEGSTISASDPTFDNVTLDAKTMSALVVASIEWFQDADNVDEVVSNAIAQAFATQLDLVSLYGSITSGAGSINLATPPNPVASSSVLGGATNGTAQTAGSFFNELLDLIFTPRQYNESPNALIYNAKMALQYAKAYDTTGQPLDAPQAVKDLMAFQSNQVPSYTQGTMASRASDVFCGDWTQLLIGQRLDFTIQALTERYAENGQVGIVAHWRGDVQVARPRAFAVYKALQGAV